MEKISDLFMLKSILLDYAKSNIAFDAIDYYQLTDIPIYCIRETLETTVGLSIDERKLLQSIIKTRQDKWSRNMRLLEIKNLKLFYEERLKENLKINGIIITMEMKQQAFDYLHANGIRIDLITYQAILRRMVKQIKEEQIRCI